MASVQTAPGFLILPIHSLTQAHQRPPSAVSLLLPPRAREPPRAGSGERGRALGASRRGSGGGLLEASKTHETNRSICLELEAIASRLEAIAIVGWKPSLVGGKHPQKMRVWGQRKVKKQVFQNA